MFNSSPETLSTISTLCLHCSLDNLGHLSHLITLQAQIMAQDERMSAHHAVEEKGITELQHGSVHQPYSVHI